MSYEELWQKMTLPELLDAWKKWRDTFQTADDHLRCNFCRDQHAFCDCGSRMAYVYLERQHLGETV